MCDDDRSLPMLIVIDNKIIAQNCVLRSVKVSAAPCAAKEHLPTGNGHNHHAHETKTKKNGICNKSDLHLCTRARKGYVFNYCAARGGGRPAILFHYLLCCSAVCNERHISNERVDFNLDSLAFRRFLMAYGFGIGLAAQFVE